MAQAAARLIMTCLNMGQAASTAMALSLQQNVTPRNVDLPELLKALEKERMLPGK